MNIYPKSNVYPKTEHLSKKLTFIQKVNIYPKTNHSSKNWTFIQKLNFIQKLLFCIPLLWLNSTEKIKKQQIRWGYESSSRKSFIPPGSYGVKVHIFWEGHKILRNLNCRFEAFSEYMNYFTVCLRLSLHIPTVQKPNLTEVSTYQRILGCLRWHYA